MRREMVTEKSTEKRHPWVQNIGEGGPLREGAEPLGVQAGLGGLLKGVGEGWVRGSSTGP